MAEQRAAIIRVIDENAAYMIKSIIVTPVLKALLLQHDVFTNEVVERVFKKCCTESEQVEEMINCLRKRIEESGCQVLDKFLRCLADSGHKHLRSQLYDKMRAAAIEVGGMQEIGE